MRQLRLESKLKITLLHSSLLFLAGIIAEAGLAMLFGAAETLKIGALLIYIAVMTFLAAMFFWHSAKFMIQLSVMTAVPAAQILYPEQEGMVLKEIAAAIRGAKKDLRILGHFFPPDPRMAKIDCREEIFNAIEEIITERSKKRLMLNYTRILQTVDPRWNQGLIHPTLFCEEDDATYRHCQRVNDIKRADPCDSVKVVYRLSRAIPSCPAMIIIDDTIAYIALTSMTLTDKGICMLKFAGAIKISDHTTLMIGEVVKIFARIEEGSLVSYIKDLAGSPESKDESPGQP